MYQIFLFYLKCFAKKKPSSGSWNLNRVGWRLFFPGSVAVNFGPLPILPCFFLLSLRWKEGDDVLIVLRQRDIYWADGGYRFRLLGCYCNGSFAVEVLRVGTTEIFLGSRGGYAFPTALLALDRVACFLSLTAFLLTLPPSGVCGEARSFLDSLSGCSEYTGHSWQRSSCNNRAHLSQRTRLR